MNSKFINVGQHYHGVSLIIMKFLSDENYNGLQQAFYDLSKESSQELELPESDTDFKQLTFKKQLPLFAPVSTYTMDNIFDNKNNDEAIKDEIDWLNQVSLSNFENCSSWSKHHSAQVVPSTVTPGIHSMLPPINKKVAPVEAQYSCMSIIHKTIKFLNENQIPIDVFGPACPCIFKRSAMASPHYFWSWKISLFNRKSSY